MVCTAVVRGRSAALALVLALVTWAPAAQANEFDRFQRARSAYEVLDYELASDLFQELVGGEVPSLTNRSLVLESRKYLAASWLFLGRAEEAKHEVERLLRDEPEYVLDPMAFPDELQRLFSRVQAELAQERERIQAEQERDARAAQAAATERKTHDARRLARLVELAETERVLETRSRWVALVPFGIGQFENGHDSLGIALAVSEGLLLSAAVASFLLHESLRDERPSEADREDAIFAEKAFRYSNQISMGLFAAVAVVGIVDAQVRFRGSEEYERKRKLPEELRGVTISLGVHGIGARAAW